MPGLRDQALEEELCNVPRQWTAYSSSTRPRKDPILAGLSSQGWVNSISIIRFYSIPFWVLGGIQRIIDQHNYFGGVCSLLAYALAQAPLQTYSGFWPPLLLAYSRDEHADLRYNELNSTLLIFHLFTPKTPTYSDTLTIQVLLQESSPHSTRQLHSPPILVSGFSRTCRLSHLLPASMCHHPVTFKFREQVQSNLFVVVNLDFEPKFRKL